MVKEKKDIYLSAHILGKAGDFTIKDMDALVLAVAHTQFRSFTMEEIDAFFGEGRKVLLDIKGLLSRKEYEDAGYLYWRL